MLFRSSAFTIRDTLIQTTDIAATSFTDLNLAENATYYFWIWTVDLDTAVTGSPLTVNTRAITAVILQALTPGRYRFDLSWTQYLPVRNDFSAYVITKTVNDVQSGVDTIRTLTTLSYTDTNNIRYGVNHIYSVATLDTNGGVGYSNGLTAEPERIKRANVTNIQASGQGGLVLQWDWATVPEPDFQAYRINRYTDLFVLQASDTIWLADTILETVPLALQWRQSTLVTTTTNIAQLSYTDNSIDQATGTYAYQVMVEDRHGNQEGGEILGNFVAMELPTVVLAEATNITAHGATLVWTPAQAANFYLLYSNTDSTGMSRENSALQAETVNLQAAVTGLGSGVTYWYAVWAKDSRGNFSQRSNLVKVQTLF